MWLTELRNNADPPIMAKAVVPIVQKTFPGYDAQLHSKVERPERYGIELCETAEKEICQHFGFSRPRPQNRRKSDNRVLTYRIQCRLNKDEYTRLQTLLEAIGGLTVQDWLRGVIVEQLDKNQ